MRTHRLPQKPPEPSLLTATQATIDRELRMIESGEIAQSEFLDAADPSNAYLGRQSFQRNAKAQDYDD